MSLRGQLNLLESSGLIRLVQVQPELEYLFRHALVQEAAYVSLLRHDRKRLHLAVGEALEQLYADRLDEFAGTLSHHFAEAGDRDKGVAYARRAARQALSMYAYEEALQHLHTALGLLETDSPNATRVAVIEELADAHRLLGQGTQALTSYRQALDMWDQIEGADKIVALRLQRKIIQTLADIKWSRDLEFTESVIEMAGQSLPGLASLAAKMEGEPPEPETVRLLSALSTVVARILFPPDWDAAQRYAQAAVDMAEQLDGKVDLSVALGTLNTALFAKGLLQEHVQMALRRLDLARDPHFDDLREKVDSLRVAGSSLMYVGEYTKALTYAEEAEALAEKIRAIDEQHNTMAIQSQCCLRLDRWDDVLKIEERWRELERRFSREAIGPT